jgi:hypothetical protein
LDRKLPQDIADAIENLTNEKEDMAAEAKEDGDDIQQEDIDAIAGNAVVENEDGDVVDLTKHEYHKEASWKDSDIVFLALNQDSNKRRPPKKGD